MTEINIEMPIRYCKECGSQMIGKVVGAEIERMVCYGMDVYTSRFASPFDSKTGKRQYVRHYQCPRWGKNWCGTENGHDEYIIEKTFTL